MSENESVDLGISDSDYLWWIKGCLITLLVLVVLFFTLIGIMHAVGERSEAKWEAAIVEDLVVEDIAAEQLVGTYLIDERSQLALRRAEQIEQFGGGRIELRADGTCEFIHIVALRGSYPAEKYPLARVSGRWELQRLQLFEKEIIAVICLEGDQLWEESGLGFHAYDGEVPDYEYFYKDAAPHGIFQVEGEVAGLRGILRTSNNESHFAVPFWKQSDDGK